MIQWKNGTVDWFDELSGQGRIRDEDGNRYYVHYSAIVLKGERTPTLGTSLNKSKTRNLEDGTQVEFIPYDCPFSRRVARVKVVYNG